MGQSKPFGFDGSELNFLEMGIIYACGRKVEADLVEAHKWFNIAAMRGDGEAARRRQEIAAEMSSFDIAHAQRRAREWMVAH
jgi:TPR repeat protein